MADITNIVDYYVNLLIIQYNNKPKARATIELLVNELLSDGIIFDVRDGYNLETAVGVQLDILGKYIGVDRFYYTNDFLDNYFGFADANDMGGTSPNIIGFDDADAPDKVGLFLDATDVIANKFRLNDETYRVLLKLKIVQNYSNHSMQSISESLFAFFGDVIIPLDNYNMTMTYLIADYSGTLVRAALTKLVLPKPMGVRLEAINGNRWFGFADAERLDLEPEYVLGFNDATTGLIKEGGFLNCTRDIIT